MTDRFLVIAPREQERAGRSPWENTNCSLINTVRPCGLRAAGCLQNGCVVQCESQIEMCNAIALPVGGARAGALCKQRAFQIHQECRGF